MDIEAPNWAKSNTDTDDAKRAKLRRLTEAPTTALSIRANELPSRAMPSNASVLPRRLKLLKDSEAPRWATSSTDTDDPKRQKLLKDNMAPRGTALDKKTLKAGQGTLILIHMIWVSTDVHLFCKCIDLCDARALRRKKICCLVLHWEPYS